MNQSQPVDIDKLLRELLSDQTWKQRRIDLLKWLEDLPSSNENIVVCLLVLTARDDAIGSAADNALKSNVHQTVLLKRPELRSIASKIINTRRVNELKQGRGCGVSILITGIIAFWASQTGYELVIADLVHLRDPLWGVLITIIGLLIIITTTISIRSLKNG